jgi:survival of motor neuron protein-interacting protein 1
MDDDDELLPRAFAVTGELPPEAGPPTTGEDYLRRVRWEARRCPNVVVSAIDPRKYDNRQTQFAALPPPCPPPPLGMAPQPQWETKFLAQFSELRQTLNHQFTKPKPALNFNLPHHNDVRGWYLLCFGAKEKEREREEKEKELRQKKQQNQQQKEGEVTAMETDSPTENAEEEQLEMYNISKVTAIGQQAIPPLMSIVTHLDQVTVMALVTHHITWLETRTMTQHRAQWIYALLARLEKPLDPDIAASLRSLLRRAAVLRSKLTDPKDPMLPVYNILITIVAKYFNQQEPDQ